MKKVIVFILLSMILTACGTRIQYVPAESVRTEYVDKYQRDSIHVLDSIYVRERGDTVFVDKYRYIYRDQIVRDTFLIRDSIRVPYPVEVVKETNRLAWYQKVLLYLSCFILVFAAGRWVFGKIA